MLSDKSQAVRNTVRRDELDKSIPFTEKRAQWEQYVLTQPIPVGIQFQKSRISNVPCTWVRNTACSANELIVYVHGGGMVEGSAITHQEYAARLAGSCCMDVLLVDYRLSPEHVYPAARNDVIAVLEGIGKMDPPPLRIFVGGESSGAGLLLSALVTRRDNGGAMPAKMFLISGVFDLTFSGRSVQALSAVDPFTSIDVLRYYAELYAPAMEKSDLGLSPLFADLSGLPPALIMVGSDEILLSDSESLDLTMTAQGVEVTLEIWSDMWHVWPMYADLPEAAVALQKISKYLRAA